MRVVFSWRFSPRHDDWRSHWRLFHAASLTWSCVRLPLNRELGGQLDNAVHGAWRTSISLPTAVQHRNRESGLYFVLAFVLSFLSHLRFEGRFPDELVSQVSSIFFLHFLWPPNRAAIIFCRCGFFFLFSSPFLSGRRLDIYHTPRHYVALVWI